MKKLINNSLFRTLRSLCCLLLLFFCLLPMALMAQVPKFGFTPVGIPATIAAATTTNLATPLLILAQNQDKIAFQFNTTWSVNGESTGNTNLLYTLAPTVDGIKYDTNKTITLAAYEYTSAGNVSTSVTNGITAGGLYGWYLIKIVNNSASGVATNGANAFEYSVKISSP